MPALPITDSFPDFLNDCWINLLVSEHRDTDRWSQQWLMWIGSGLPPISDDKLSPMLVLPNGCAHMSDIVAMLSSQCDVHG